MKQRSEAVIVSEIFRLLTCQLHLEGGAGWNGTELFDIKISIGD